MSARLGDVITSRAELDTVPVGAILRDRDGYIVMRHDDTDWYVVGPDAVMTVDAGEIDGAYSGGESSSYPLAVILVPATDHARAEQAAMLSDAVMRDTQGRAEREDLRAALRAETSRAAELAAELAAYKGGAR